jgi:hypothetical protein
MKQIAQLFLVSLLSLCISQTASAQITTEWVSDQGGWFYAYESVYISGYEIDAEIHHKPFRVTSGSGYIDMTATLDATGNSTTTRMWVEEGFVYWADLRLDIGGGRSVNGYGDICYSMIFDSPAFSTPGEYKRVPNFIEIGNNNWGYRCPSIVTITTQDEIQVNASNGTFADHVRITWNEMEGATGYQIFRCTGGFSSRLGGYGESSECGAAIGSTQGNGFNDTGGIDEKSYWYKVKVCTAGDCGDFSKADYGYRGDGLDDHGNNCAEATPVGSNSTTPGVIENSGTWVPPSSGPVSTGPPRDEDYFRIELPSVASLTVKTTGSTGTLGRLWDDGCTKIAAKSDGGEGNNFLMNEELVAGTYYVSVIGGTGPYQFVSSFEASSALPEPPAEVRASDGAWYDAIRLSWSAVNLASSYKIYYSEEINSSRVYLGPTTETDVFVTELKSGVVFYLWVSSVNANGESEDARSDTGYGAVKRVPNAPALDSATPGDRSAVLSFTAPHSGGSDITGYTASCGGFSQSGTASPITVSGLTNGTEYFCWVLATNAIGNSSPSAPLFVTPLAPASTFTISGSVSGLSGSGLVLQNNAGDNLPITTDGTFTFDIALDDGSNYAVTVLTQPTSPSQTCNVSSGSGTLAGTDITGILVTCIVRTENIFTDGFES